MRAAMQGGFFAHIAPIRNLTDSTTCKVITEKKEKRSNLMKMQVYPECPSFFFSGKLLKVFKKIVVSWPIF